MDLSAYLIPEKITNVTNDRTEHTWVGIRLSNGDYLFVMTTTKFKERYSKDYKHWFTKDNGVKVYIKLNNFKLLTKSEFKNNYKPWRVILANNLDARDYIRRNTSDTKHLNDFSEDQWQQIFNNSYYFTQQNESSLQQDIIPPITPSVVSQHSTNKKSHSKGIIIGIIFGMLIVISIILTLVFTLK